jgi:hypothetical protein
MKIETITTQRLRNNEHFQFHTEFRDLVTGARPEMLNIEDSFETYLVCYANEDVAFQKIVKSATTAEIEAADKSRDQIYRGMADTNKAAVNHFDGEISAAARRLKIVFDTYGNLSAKPLNEETSAIYNLLQELTGNYAADVQKVGLSAWVTQLDVENKAFDALMKSRVDEQAAKTELKMKQTRNDTDKAYAVIVERINALIVVEGAANYETFVRKLNIVINTYKNLLAQRKGKKSN